MTEVQALICISPFTDYRYYSNSLACTQPQSWPTFPGLDKWGLVIKVYNKKLNKTDNLSNNISKYFTNKFVIALLVGLGKYDYEYESII